MTQTLCTIRRPVVWYLDKIRYASDRDGWERSSWHSERSSDESEMFDYHSRQRPGKTPLIWPSDSSRAKKNLSEKI